jgi:hypothetical protein
VIDCAFSDMMFENKKMESNPIVNLNFIVDGFLIDDDYVGKLLRLYF